MSVIEFQTHTKNELAGVDWAKNIDEYRFSPTPPLYMIFFSFNCESSTEKIQPGVVPI